jgi:hypothetical protein
MFEMFLIFHLQVHFSNLRSLEIKYHIDILFKKLKFVGAIFNLNIHNPLISSNSSYVASEVL